MARMMKSANSVSNASHPDFEATCWATADKFRGNLDAAEYKHVVLGLIFLKYISEAVGKLRMTNVPCRVGKTRPRAALSTSHFGTRTSARPSLKNTLPKDYTRPRLDKQSLARVLDLIGSINFRETDSNASFARVQHFKLRTVKCEFRNARAFHSTIEIRHSEFAPSSNPSGEAEICRIAVKTCSPAP